MSKDSVIAGLERDAPLDTSLPLAAPESIIAAYDALVERAIKILYWPEPVYTPPPMFARLSIDGDMATLTWPRAELEFGDPTIDNSSATFPASLLLLSDAELPAALTAWTDERKAAAEKARRAERAAAAELGEEAHEEQPRVS